MKPGIYKNLPSAIYHAAPGASHSRLEILTNHCPAELRWQMDNPPKPKRVVGTGDAMEFGTALHDAVLLPERFGTDYAGLPFTDLRAKGAQEWVDSQPEERVILRVDALTKITAMRAAIMSHSSAGRLIRAATHRELSVFWTDPETVVLCKMRTDIVVLSGATGIVLDLKTTANPHPAAFEFSSADYGYHRQAAMYLDGLNQVGISVGVVGLIPVSKDPPYVCTVSPMSTAAIELGRIENRQLLAIYAECEKSGVWPAYDEMQTLNLPSNYRRLNLSE